jgi:hypothetical protein
MVVNGDCELLFGRVLTDYVLIQIFFQFQWLRELVRRAVGLIVPIVLKD